jgi:hypothetical protein
MQIKGSKYTIFDTHQGPHELETKASTFVQQHVGTHTVRVV